MSLYDQIMATYPELTALEFMNGIIVLQNDSDKKGDYIVAWNYSKPVPAGLKVGK